MNANIRNKEDRSVLALLYDEHRRMYPQITLSVQREIEEFYRQLYGHELENPEEISAVFIGLCDDEARFAYEEGVKCGVRLAMDLELDSMVYGGGSHVSDC